MLNKKRKEVTKLSTRIEYQARIVEIPTRYMRWFPFFGITLFGVIFTWYKLDLKELYHELCHVYQYERDKFLFYPKYIFDFVVKSIRYRSLRKGYMLNKYEVEARIFALLATPEIRRSSDFY